MKHIKQILLLSALVLVSQLLLAQADDCPNMQAFCSDGGATFPAGVDNGTFQPGGNSYSCGNGVGQDLITQPNAAWYYLEISTAGNLNIDLATTPAEDIDFALWGPYANLGAAQGDCGSLPDPIDCSFSTATEEQANIGGAQVGEVYILMITNYSNNPTQISATATSNSTAATDCDIITCQASAGTGNTSATTGGVSGNDIILCDGQSASIISNDDYVLPNPVTGESAELMYAVYNCAPPANPDQ